MSSLPKDFRRLSAETTEALAKLRQTLRRALDRILPEGYGARSLGRTLGLGRMTAWRCWRIAHAADPAVVLPELPGRLAWKEIIDRLDDRGLRPDERKALREAFARLEPIVFGRRADRAALRTMAAGGLDPESSRQALRDIRRATTRGAATLYGVKAKTIVLTWTVAPGRRRHSVSFGLAGAMDGISRLRPDLPWPILQRTVVLQAGGTRDFYAPLGDDPKIPHLLRGVSTPGVSGTELRLERRPDRETIDLGEVAPERNGSLRIFHAEFMPDAGTLDPGPPDLVPLLSSILVPADSVVFSLAFHRETPPHSEPFVSLLHPPVYMDVQWSFDRAIRVPLEVAMRRARGLGLPRRCAALEEGHREAFRRVTEAQGVKGEDFLHYRIDLPYPTPFSVVAGQFEMTRKG